MGRGPGTPAARPFPESMQFTPMSLEAYDALSLHKLGTRYIPATYSDSYITAIACDGDTHMNVTVGPPTQSYNGRTYSAGQIIHVYLAWLNTFQIQGSGLILTKYLYTQHHKLRTAYSNNDCWRNGSQFTKFSF